MIIVMKKDATQKQVDVVLAAVASLGLKAASLSKGEDRLVIGCVGQTAGVNENQFSTLEGVEQVIRVANAFKLASREMKRNDTIVEVDGVKIGGSELAVIAGPCSVESREQFLDAARAVKEGGGRILRGSIFKPRTSPYDFQGVGVKGLKWLDEACDETGLLMETEVMDPRQVKLVEDTVDLLRVGSRNMQNFDLLKQVGKSDKPVILKRGMVATVKEFLLAAEYVLSEGNPGVVLCERGIRTFSTDTRFTLDISVVPVLKKLSHLPVIVDPSHAGGRRDLVAPLSKAAIAVGADGLMIEVHANPSKALSDGEQQLVPSEFAALMQDLKPIAQAVNKTI